MSLKSIAALLVAIHPLIAIAQTYTVNETAKAQADYLHEYFRPVPDRYIDVHYASPHGAFSYKRNEKRTEIVAYDARLNEEYSKPVKALSGNLINNCSFFSTTTILMRSVQTENCSMPA